MNRKQNRIAIMALSVPYIIFLIAITQDRISVGYMIVFKLCCAILALISGIKWYKKYKLFWIRRGHIEKTKMSYYRWEWNTGDKEIDELHESVIFWIIVYLICSFTPVFLKGVVLFVRYYLK